MIGGEERAAPTAGRRDLVGRALVILTVTTAVAWFTWIVSNPEHVFTDFQYYYRATRLWASGVDPYSVRPRAAWITVWPLRDALFYPLPALLLTGPFAVLPMRAAQVAFVALATGLLSWRLTRTALWPLLIIASPGFLMAALLGQWSPWLTLGALVPQAGFLLAAKPTLGLACFCYRPTWRAVISGGAIVVVSLVLMPDWPVEWLENLRSVLGHPAPIAAPLGWILALAVLRWRQPEARLLLAMACVPQLLFFADQVPLFLVARTRREAWFYTLAGLVVGAIWVARQFMRHAAVALTGPDAMLGCYLPALWIVLRRPNEGDVPEWLERRVSVLPAWMRGRRDRGSSRLA